jgi:hypothetical protein
MIRRRQWVVKWYIAQSIVHFGDAPQNYPKIGKVRTPHNRSLRSSRWSWGKAKRPKCALRQQPQQQPQSRSTGTTLLLSPLLLLL